MAVKHIIYVIVSCHFISHTGKYQNGVLMACFEVWSNFEIADLDFWRGEAYTAFFEYLDSRGGFYYEVRPFISMAQLFKHQNKN